jgi:hypothetical protein
MRRIIPVAALAFVFAGCAMPLHHWNFPPGRTQQDFSRDHRLCNLEAQMTVRPAFPRRIDRHYIRMPNGTRLYRNWQDGATGDDSGRADAALSRSG